MTQQKLPAYEVHEVEGPIEVTRYRYVRDYERDPDGEFVRDDKGNKVMLEKRREAYKATVDRAWDVFFPRGHSIRVLREKDMQRLGFDLPPKMISADLDSEQEDDGAQDTGVSSSLQERQRRMVGRNRRRRTATSSGSASAEVS